MSPGRASRGRVAVLASVLPGQLLVEPSVELMAFWELVDAQYGDAVPVFGGRVVDALDDVALVELIVQLEPDASLARARDTRCLSPICEMPARRCDLDHRIKTHARSHPHRDTDRTTIWTPPPDTSTPARPTHPPY